MPTFWKPEARKKTKAREKREKQQARTVCRQEVLEDDHHRCRACGAPAGYWPLEVHEEPPRSQGGDPTDPKQCVTLCKDCHEKRTRNRMAIEILDSDQGTRGKLRFTLWLTDHVARAWVG